MMKHSILVLIFSLTILIYGNGITVQPDQQTPDTTPIIEGDYLGQPIPGDTPCLFAPGIISTGFHEHSFPAFSPDGKEVYWSAWVNPFPNEVILFVKRVKNRWTTPEVASFSGKYIEGGPCFSPDGQKLFYASKRPLPGSTDVPKKRHLWYVERQGDRWSEPQSVIYTPGFFEVRPSITTDGTIYFMADYTDGEGQFDIYRIKPIDDGYSKPENLGPSINSKFKEFSAFITLDESFLIFSRFDHPDGDGLYISFKKKDGTWTVGRNMGETINTTPSQRFPAVSPDGKYLFFTSARLADKFQDGVPPTYEMIKKRQLSPQNGLDDVYWMKADIIYHLKKTIIQPNQP